MEGKTWCWFSSCFGRNYMSLLFGLQIDLWHQFGLQRRMSGKRRSGSLAPPSPLSIGPPSPLTRPPLVSPDLRRCHRPPRRHSTVAGLLTKVRTVVIRCLHICTEAEAYCNLEIILRFFYCMQSKNFRKGTHNEIRNYFHTNFYFFAFKSIIIFVLVTPTSK